MKEDAHWLSIRLTLRRPYLPNILLSIRDRVNELPPEIFLLPAMVFTIQQCTHLKSRVDAIYMADERDSVPATLLGWLTMREPRLRT